jgi:hypothetical protein
MINPLSNSPNVSLARQIACAVQNTCEEPPASSKGDFGRLLKQATDLAGAGYACREAAVNAFFQALNAATSFDQATQVLLALPRGYAYRDVTFAALSAGSRKIETREQALTVAGEAFERGHAYDNWAVGALDRALTLSKTNPEVLEIANLAKDHEHLGRFRKVQEKAVSRLR